MSSELENAVRRGGGVAWCGCGVEPCGGGRAVERCVNVDVRSRGVAVRRGGIARRDGAAMGSRGVTVRRWAHSGVVYKNDDSFQI